MSLSHVLSNGFTSRLLEKFLHQAMNSEKGLLSSFSFLKPLQTFLSLHKSFYTIEPFNCSPSHPLKPFRCSLLHLSKNLSLSGLFNRSLHLLKILSRLRKEMIKGSMPEEKQGSLSI